MSIDSESEWTYAMGFVDWCLAYRDSIETHILTTLEIPGGIAHDVNGWTGSEYRFWWDVLPPTYFNG